MPPSELYKLLETVETAIRSLPLKYLPGVRSIVNAVIDELLQANGQPQPAKPPRKRKEDAQ